MIEQEEIDRVIVDSIQVDDEGIKNVKTFSIAEIIKLGVVDVAGFLDGLLDAENDQEFKQSSEGYIKGYSYGKTGKF